MIEPLEETTEIGGIDSARFRGLLHRRQVGPSILDVLLASRVRRERLRIGRAWRDSRLLHFQQEVPENQGGNPRSERRPSQAVVNQVVEEREDVVRRASLRRRAGRQPVSSEESGGLFPGKRDEVFHGSVRGVRHDVMVDPGAVCKQRPGDQRVRLPAKRDRASPVGDELYRIEGKVRAVTLVVRGAVLPSAAHDDEPLGR
jgi:hypothetical protein